MSVGKKNDANELENLNETGHRSGEERRQETKPVAGERREVQRRRQIDPTTCERDYTDDEIEFMQALDQYKRNSGRMFPTCSEILEVLIGMGYRRVIGADGEVREPFLSAAPSVMSNGETDWDDDSQDEMGDDE